MAEHAHELLRRFGSPLYVYDLDEIERRYLRFVGAFPYRPLDCHFAVVCNKNPLIVRRLARARRGRAREHARRRLRGARRRRARGRHRLQRHEPDRRRPRLPARTGSGAQRRLARPAARRRAPRRLPERGASVPGRRSGEAEPHRGRARASSTRRFGSRRPARLRIAGLHMYAGTNNRRPSRFLDCVDRLLAAAETLPDLEYVNLGGGYGIGYREGEPDLRRRSDRARGGAAAGVPLAAARGSRSG